MSVRTNPAATDAARARGKNGLLVALLVLLVGTGAYFWGRSSLPAQPPQGVAESPAGDAHDAEESAHGEEGNEAHGPDEHDAEGIVKFDDAALKLARLRLATVRETALPARLNVTGVVEPNLSGVAKVTARVAGKVIALHAGVGDTAHSGQKLATLASAELAAAQAAYHQAAAKVSLTRDTLGRQRRLAQLGEFGRHKVEEARTRASQAQGETQVADREMAEAQAEVAGAESDRKASQAAVDQAENQVAVARARFERAEALYREELLSRQDWEQARAETKKAASDLEAARANLTRSAAEIESRKAHLRSAQSKLQTARRNEEIAAEQRRREEAIYKGGYLTSQEIVQAEAALKQAQLERNAAAENVRLLGGEPGGGSLLAIRAPIAGRITERAVTLGETVSPEKPLFTLLNTATVWVQLNVFQKDLPAVNPGQAVTVTTDSAPEKTFRGTVSYISETVDEATRTVKVRCVIRNAGGRLKPGVFVVGSIAGSARAGIAVPREAVQELEGRQVVFVAEEHEGEFRPQPVETGDARGALVEIRSGLNAGDRIVTQNAFTVKAQAMRAELGEGHAH